MHADDKKGRRHFLLATEARLRARAARCPSLRTHTAHEVGHRLTDLIGAVLLDEVAAHHHHFGLVRCVDKELGTPVRREADMRRRPA